MYQFSGPCCWLIPRYRWACVIHSWGEFGGFNGNHEIILPPISHPHTLATEQMLDKIVILFGSYVYRTFTISKWFSIDNIFLILCSRWSRQPILCSSPVSITCCIEWHVMHMAHEIQYHVLHSYGLPCYILTSEQDDQRLADIFKCILLNENLSLWFQFCWSLLLRVQLIWS